MNSVKAKNDCHIYQDSKHSCHYTILSHENYEQPQIPYNTNTLYFHDKKLNRKFEKYLRMDQETKCMPSTEFKYNLLVFYTFLNCFIVIFVLFTILMYFTNINKLKIHLACLGSIWILSMTGLYFVYNIKQFLINSKIFFLVLSMLISSYLIMTSGNVLNYLLGLQNNSDELPNILVLTCFTVLFRSVIFDCYFIVLISCLYTCLLHLAINLSFSNASIFSSLSEFCVITLFMTVNVVDSQLVDIRSRQLFWRLKQEELLSCENENSQEFIKIRTIISLSQKCQLIISNLKRIASVIMFKDLRSLLKKSINDVMFVQKNLSVSDESNLIYEEIEKSNELDEDDKQFIAENYSKRNDNTMKRRNAKSLTIVQFPIKKISDKTLLELEDVLNDVGTNWSLDIWTIFHKTNHSILIIGEYLFHKYDLSEYLKINSRVHEAFFDAIETGYKCNPYHNACHGADVCHSLLYFFLQSYICKSLGTLETIISIVAAFAHDIGHPGLTNRFIINNKEKLALEYNDISVLENMHCCRLFTVLLNPDVNIFQNINETDWRFMRKFMIFMILETDMSRHFEILGKFKGRIQSFDWENDENKMDILGMGLKCADIGHSAKVIEIHEKWTSLVCEEFFLQGDREKLKKQSVSMYCDRDNTDVAKSQSGFIKNICIPLYEIWCLQLNSDVINNNCLRQLEKNLNYWDEKYKLRKITLQIDNLIEKPSLLQNSPSQGVS